MNRQIRRSFDKQRRRGNKEMASMNMGFGPPKNGLHFKIQQSKVYGRLSVVERLKDEFILNERGRA